MRTPSRLSFNCTGQLIEVPRTWVIAYLSLLFVLVLVHRQRAPPFPAWLSRLVPSDKFPSTRIDSFEEVLGLRGTSVDRSSVVKFRVNVGNLVSTSSVSSFRAGSIVDAYKYFTFFSLFLRLLQFLRRYSRILFSMMFSKVMLFFFLRCLEFELN